MKKTILSIAAAVAISMGAVGAATTASAADVATPVVAVKKADTVNPNAGVKIRIRYGYYYGYKPYYGYGYGYVGSYRHCKHLLHKWKYYGSWYAKKKFYRLGCARYFY